MRGFIKTWWHCLWILLTDIKHAGEHRMTETVLINPADPLDWTFMHSEWKCSHELKT